MNDERSSALLPSISWEVAVCTGAGTFSIGRSTPGSGAASTTVTVVANVAGCGGVLVCAPAPALNATRRADRTMATRREWPNESSDAESTDAASIVLRHLLTAPWLRRRGAGREPAITLGADTTNRPPVRIRRQWLPYPT